MSHSASCTFRSTFGSCHLTQSLDLDFSRRSFKSLTKSNNFTIDIIVVIVAQWKQSFERKRTRTHSALIRTQIGHWLHHSVAKRGGSLHCTVHKLTVRQTHSTSLDSRTSFSAIRGRNPFNIPTKIIHSQNVRQLTLHSLIYIGCTHCHSLLAGLGIHIHAENNFRSRGQGIRDMGEDSRI